VHLRSFSHRLRFNNLVRGLPGISRSLLAERLRRLQQMGIVEKLQREKGRQSTEYQLTEAGRELQPVVGELLTWGARWAFGEPEPEDLDPILLLWWMRSRVRVERLPERRVVVQFDFTGAQTERHWLILTKDDVSVCLTHPGYDIDVLVTADLATLFQIWLGRTEFADALSDRQVEIDAIPKLARAFPGWFAYSPAAEAVRVVKAEVPLGH
jgi:DNA-binding HxlR family transcriptional regulator